MKKQNYFFATLCAILLFAATVPTFAQSKSDKDEYEEVLRKLFNSSGTSKTMDDLVSKLNVMMRTNASGKDAAYWKEFVAKWQKIISEKSIDIYMPIYKKHLPLEELKEVVAFYESPVGKKYRESSRAVTIEGMPQLLKEIQGDMLKEIQSGVESQKSSSSRPVPDAESRRKQRDRKLFEQAYVLPADSVAVVTGKEHRMGESTAPILYSIEKRRKDTKVTFMQPIYFDSQWLYFSPGFKIIDKRTGDEYCVRGYDGVATMDRLLVVRGFNHKYIYVSLIFPKLKKGVKMVDIVETPHEKDKEILPSNDDGIAKSYFNIRLEDYLADPGKNSKKIYR